MRLFLNQRSFYFIFFYLFGFDAPFLSCEVERAVPTQREVHRKIDMMLALHVKPHKTKEDIEKIRALQEELESYKCRFGSSPRDFDDPHPYDGSDNSLVRTVAYAGYGREGFVGAPEDDTWNSHPYRLSVATLHKAPGLVHSIMPTYGSMRDVWIVRLDVYDKDDNLAHESFPIKVFERYLKATKPTRGACLNGTSKERCGTIMQLYWCRQNRLYEIAISTPYLLDKVPTKKLPYAVWSTKNAYNKRVFEKMKPLFYKAKAAITQHWVRKGCTPVEAEDYALRALYYVPFFTTYNYKGSGLLDQTKHKAKATRWALCSATKESHPTA